MRKMKSFSLVMMLLILVNQAFAQMPIYNSMITNKSYIKIGIEPTTMITVGFQRNVNLDLIQKSVTTYLEWGTSLFRFGLKNSDLKIGGSFYLYEKGDLRLINSLHLSVGSLTTHNFDSKKLAMGDEVMFGYFKKSWFMATTFEYEKILLNHIEHTNFYRTTYYADAKDGWYKGAGGMFQIDNLP